VLTTNPNPAGPVALGTTLNDAATLSGFYGVPGGTITFKLYKPSSPPGQCLEKAFEETVSVASDGTASTTSGWVANLAGDWNWTAYYSGDDWNEPASSGCGLETVSVNKADLQNTFTTTPDPGDAFVGDTLEDKASLGGSEVIEPTGTITFNLYPPGDGHAPAPGLYQDRR
jgi:hypothetical protein